MAPFLCSHLENFCISGKRQIGVKKGQRKGVHWVAACACVRITFVKVNDFRLSVHVHLFFQQVVLVVWSQCQNEHTVKTNLQMLCNHALCFLLTHHNFCPPSCTHSLQRHPSQTPQSGSDSFWTYHSDRERHLRVSVCLRLRQ